MSGGRGCRESLRCRDLRRLGALGSQSAVDAQGNISMPAVPLNQPEADRGEMPRLGVARSGGGGAEPDWQDKITACPVFYPSKKEFEDPMSYIRSIAAKASVYGICKIVSPVVSSVSAGTVLSKERSNFKFTTRVQPMRLANWDSKDHITFLISGRPYTFHDFEKMANKVAFRRYQTTGDLPPRFIESEFWREMASGKTQSVEYACDIEGSAFSSCQTDPLGNSRWNLKVLPYSSQSILRLLQNSIPGVTDPMLYIGMLFSMFAWHVEDHYLYSINYLHCGAPKTWYGVPGVAAPDFERVARDNVYDPVMLAEKGDGAAYDLLIGKTTLFSPKLLCDNNIPVYRAVQGPGEFVITFPRAYHAGFSHGFNCGEAVNFAMPDWLPFGAAACRRYVLLNRLPLLPHEELLCREAMHHSTIQAASGFPDVASGTSFVGYEHEKCLKVSFVRLMRFQHKVRWFLKQHAARSVVRQEFEGSELCSLCKHMCYVAYISCSCVQLPFCLNHAKEIRQCSCGTQRLVNIKNNLCEMEQAARQFEKEDGILEELCREPTVTDVTNINGAVLEESMFDSNDYMSYVWDVDLKDDLLAAPHTLCPDTQAADVVQGPVKRYSSVSVIVNKSTSNLQSFSRATRALGSLSCVPHFGTPVQAVPVEVLPPDEPDHGHLAPVVPLTIVEAPPCQRVDERDVVDEKLSKSCTCSSELGADCYCSSQTREIGSTSVKRKRSGLTGRQARSWSDEHARKSEVFQEPRSTPCIARGILPSDHDDEDDDDIHTIKRQRMASLDKITSDSDPGSMAPKMPQYVPATSPLRAAKVDRVGRYSKKGPIRLWATPQGDFVLLLADIIRELHIKRALLEVVSLWQSKAKKISAELQFLYIHPIHLPSSKRHPALTLKGCLCVKSFLSLQDGLKLQNMIQSTFGKQEGLVAEEKLSPKESSNDASEQCLRKKEMESNHSHKLVDNFSDNLVNVQVHGAPEELPVVPKLIKKQGKLKGIRRSLQSANRLKGSKCVEPSVPLPVLKENSKQIRNQTVTKQGSIKQQDLSQRSICLNEFSATSNGERLRKKKSSTDIAVEERCATALKRLKTVMKPNSVTQNALGDVGPFSDRSPECMALRRNDVKVGRLKVKGPSVQNPPTSSDGTEQNSNTCGMKRSTISSAEGIDEGSTGSVVCRAQTHVPEASSASPEVVVKRKRGRPRKNRPVQHVSNKAGKSCDEEVRAYPPPKEEREEPLEGITPANHAFKSRFLEEIVSRPADDGETMSHEMEGKDRVEHFAEEKTSELWQHDTQAAFNETPVSRSDVVEVSITHVECVGRKESGKGVRQLPSLSCGQGTCATPVLADAREVLGSPSRCTGQKLNDLIEVPIKELCGERVICGNALRPDAMGEIASPVSEVPNDTCATMKLVTKDNPSPATDSTLAGSTQNDCGNGMNTDVKTSTAMEYTVTGWKDKVLLCSHDQAFRDQQGKLEKGPLSSAMHEGNDSGLGVVTKSQGMLTRPADESSPCNDSSIQETSMDSMLKGMPLLTEALDFPNSDLFSGELAQLSFGASSQWKFGNKTVSSHVDELGEAWKFGKETPSALANNACMAGSLQSVVFPSSLSTGQTNMHPGVESQTMEASYGQWQKGRSEVTNELLSAASHYAKVSSTNQSNARSLSRLLQSGASNVRIPSDAGSQMHSHLQQSSTAMWSQWSPGLQNSHEFNGGMRSSRESYDCGCVDLMEGPPVRAACWPEISYDPPSSQNDINPHGGGFCGALVYPDRPAFSSPYAPQQQHGMLSGYWGNVGGLEGHVLAARLESLAQQARAGEPWGNNNSNLQGGVRGIARVGLAQSSTAGSLPNSVVGYGGHCKPRGQHPGQHENPQLVPWPPVPTFNGIPATSSMSRLPPLPNSQRAHHQYHSQVHSAPQAAGDTARLPLLPSYPAPGITGMSQSPMGPGMQTTSMHRYEETRISNQLAHQTESTWQMGNQKFIEVRHSVFL